MAAMRDAVFIFGKLQNAANRREHWTEGASYKRVWRQKVWLAFRQYVYAPGIPKRVSIAANVWNLFDAHDGLRLACKPIVDGLVDAAVIHSDGPDCGHVFEYSQEIHRQQLGVAITVEVLTMGEQRTIQMARDFLASDPRA